MIFRTPEMKAELFKLIAELEVVLKNEMTGDSQLKGCLIDYASFRFVMNFTFKIYILLLIHPQH